MRTSRWDALMTALAAAQGVLLLAMPTAPAIALGLWWNSNTISHNFIHRPFFRRRSANALFAAYESVLLGIPQTLWRDRHLAHHAGVHRRTRISTELAVQAALVLSLWLAIASRAPAFFLSVYVPGYVAGLMLCAMHGYYEHARGGTSTSHYGTWYNRLCFNDGYHAEHHARPNLHWTQLPARREPAAHVSAWPAPLRWMEGFSLQALERLVLRSRVLQWFVLRAHARALRPLVAALPPAARIVIVGGGLFPRTALILRELLPAARITIVDANRANLERARTLLGSASGAIDFIHAHYEVMPWAATSGRPYKEDDAAACDLLVIPLSFDGDRTAIYARPPAPAVVVHDWIWRKRGASRLVSIALLKRINLVRA